MHLRKQHQIVNEEQHPKVVLEEDEGEENKEKHVVNQVIREEEASKKVETSKVDHKKQEGEEEGEEEEKAEDDIVTPLVSFGQQKSGGNAKAKRQQKVSTIGEEPSSQAQPPQTNKKLSKAKASIASVMSGSGGINSAAGNGNPLMMLSKSNSKVINEDMALIIMKNIFK